MSDHGFAHYRWRVNLNTWLLNHGYLSLLPPDRMGHGPLGHIDWVNTQAYALGLNQLFINTKGREPDGIVGEDERELLVARLTRELEAWIHPETGENVVSRVVAPPGGDFTDRAPDLLVGYNRKYRSSDESAQGILGQEEITPNNGKWSGDHCMDPELVPGVLISPKTVDKDDPTLLDFAPTVLKFFDLTPPDEMAGGPLF